MFFDLPGSQLSSEIILAPSVFNWVALMELESDTDFTEADLDIVEISASDKVVPKERTVLIFVCKVSTGIEDSYHVRLSEYIGRVKQRIRDAEGLD